MGRRPFVYHANTTARARRTQPAPFPKETTIEVKNDYLSAFYIRISISDGLGIITRVGEAAEKVSAVRSESAARAKRVR